MNVTLDTTRDPNRGFTVDAAAVPLAHVFTKPGVYTVGFNIETRDKDGNFSYKSRSAHFVVGDAAISALRAITAENNGETPSPSPSPNPADPGADAPPSGGAQPSNPSTPDPGDSAIHIITEGHMDQAMSLKDGKAEVFVDDTADPRHPVHRASGTFAYAVPDSTHAKIPAGAKGYSELAAAAPEGVWSLPETQLEGIPWVGFSTQRVDYSQLSSKGVEVAMRNFTGPGRLVTGISSLFEGFTPDSTRRSPTWSSTTSSGRTITRLSTSRSLGATRPTLSTPRTSPTAPPLRRRSMRSSSSATRPSRGALSQTRARTKPGACAEPGARRTPSHRRTRREA